MKKEIISRYIDTIILATNKTLLKKLGYTFVDGECEVEMEFYDGEAYATDGTGLMLTYPKMEELTERQIDAICDYTGIYDSINQYDVAMKYGKVSSSNDELATIHVFKDRDLRLRDETLVVMSADIFQEVYDMSSEHDTHTTADIVRTSALKFEKELDWQGAMEEERDYIEELEKFEKKELADLHEQYDD